MKLSITYMLYICKELAEAIATYQENLINTTTEVYVQFHTSKDNHWISLVAFGNETNHSMYFFSFMTEEQCERKLSDFKREISSEKGLDFTKFVMMDR